MKKIIIITAIAAYIINELQVSTVCLQESGLTCGMCSNAINKSLKTPEFALKTDTSISAYTFVIAFKPGSTVDFDIIKCRVEGAGFAISSFITTINLNNAYIMPGANRTPIRQGF